MSLEEKKRPINVGLIGFGTVGTGVVKYFKDGGENPFKVHLRKVAIADSSKPRAVSFSPLTTDAADIIKDPKIDIVVELMGGVGQAKTYMLAAINNGKSVVTANKAVMSRHSKELFDAARSRGVDLGFEASVGGGIPIIRTLLGYIGEQIIRIMGIVNGTTNYMLTKMAEDGLDFETALRGAQASGFAEANHILDTGGSDARDKLAILASIVFNTQIDIGKIPCRGIVDITPIDIDFAREHGYAIKLLAMASRNNGSVELQVTPALISNKHPLASTRNEFNMLYIEGSLIGPQTFYGRGAGPNPTTSAVISDILRLGRNRQLGVTDELPTLNSEVTYTDPDEVKQRGYIRVGLIDRPGSLHGVSGILYEHGLNVKNSLQREQFGVRMNGDVVIPDIITLDPTPNKVIRSALEKMASSPGVYGEPFFLPIID